MRAGIQPLTTSRSGRIALGSLTIRALIFSSKPGVWVIRSRIVIGVAKSDGILKSR